MFKKIKTALVSVLMVATCFIGASNNILAFGNLSHETITRIAYKKTIENLRLKFSQEQLDYVVKHCTGPDKDEKSGAGGKYQGHFIDISKIEKDFLNEDNALTRLNKHWENACLAVKNDNFGFALWNLSRALHYLQDMCCIVHLWGYSYNCTPGHLAQHADCENILDAMCKYDKFEYLKVIELSCNQVKIDMSLTPIELGKYCAQLTYEKCKKFGWNKFENVIELNGWNPGGLIGQGIAAFINLCKGVYHGDLWWDYGDEMLTLAVQSSYKLIYLFMQQIGDKYNPYAELDL